MGSSFFCFFIADKLTFLFKFDRLKSFLIMRLSLGESLNGLLIVCCFDGELLGFFDTLLFVS